MKQNNKATREEQSPQSVGHDLLDNVEFFDLMQSYRIAPIENQERVIERYEKVKDYIREKFKPCKQNESFGEQVGHTPGDWHVTRYNDGQYSISNSQIGYEEKQLSDGEDEANARLIAAAPAMYKTLQETYDFIQKLYQIKAFNTKDNFSLVNEGAQLRNAVYNITNSINNK